jgi:hypothetical protein
LVFTSSKCEVTLNLELIAAIVLIPLTMKTLVAIIFLAYVIVTSHTNDWEYGIALNGEPAVIGVECDVMEPLIEDCLDHLSLFRTLELPDFLLPDPLEVANKT